MAKGNKVRGAKKRGPGGKFVGKSGPKKSRKK